MHRRPPLPEFRPPSTPKIMSDQANLTIHNPSVFSYEYSSAEITMKNDPDYIQVGWTVNPIYYKGDLTTRMFIYTETARESCYNVDCPGFVLVRSDIPVDSVLTPFYEPRGPFSNVDFFIFQDTTIQNWWLKIGHDEEPIEFWPGQIFTSLSKSGSHVECGGEVYHDPATPGSTQMGSGFMPSKHVATNSYCYSFVIVNEDVKVVLVRDTEAYSDNGDWYGIEDKIVPKHGGDTNIVIEFEHIVIYGGRQNYSLSYE
ncbi:hypothetical protein RND81_06G240400 [Saponaria officinalis]|uniref:Neprosin PEP catalytic domain-containing protein n=1 Tax=Saponaria officinalis TaxID=3572 RepID=A0AAW1KA84_SAPOF